MAGSAVSLGKALKGRHSRGVSGDAAFRALARAAALTILGLTLLFVVQLFLEAQPALSRYGGQLLTGTRWSPGRDFYGGLTFIYGTLVSSLIAVVLGGLVGIGTAVFLTELAPRWLSVPVGYLVELLAAIPSVVYGFWGIAVLVPWLATTGEPFLKTTLGFLPLFQGPTFGTGMLAAGLVLAIMILPTVAAVSRDVIQAVPTAQREGMLALGATRWEMISRVVLPLARTGIVGALILGLGRALGETIAATMLIGNSPQIKPSLFAPAYSMASVIANQFNESTGIKKSALIGIGLMLFMLTLLVNIVAQLFVWRMNRRLAASR